LAEEKSKLSNEIEGLKKEKEKEFCKMVDSFKDDATQSYIVGFETALEQAAIVHPIVDFSELNPGKIIVDGKLVEDS